MFTVIEIGSLQYKVKEGDIIEVNRLGDKEGDSINIEKVLMYQNGDDVRVGKPYLKDVKVAAKVVQHTKGEKTIAFKYRKRKDSASKKGHRAKLTALNITKISA